MHLDLHCRKIVINLMDLRGKQHAYVKISLEYGHTFLRSDS